MKTGNNVFISIDGETAIAATRTNSIRVGCRTIEVASMDQQDWEEVMPGRKTWQMTVTFLVTAVKPNDPRNPLNVGQFYTLFFMTRGSATDRISGTALCTQCEITANRGNLCTGSITFTGSGPLT